MVIIKGKLTQKLRTYENIRWIFPAIIASDGKHLCIFFGSNLKIMVKHNELTPSDTILMFPVIPFSCLVMTEHMYLHLY